MASQENPEENQQSQQSQQSQQYQQYQDYQFRQLRAAFASSVMAYSSTNLQNRIIVCRLELLHTDTNQEEIHRHYSTGSGTLFYIQQIGESMYGVILTAASLFHKQNLTYCSGTIIFQSKQQKDYMFNIIKIVLPRQFKENDNLQIFYDYAFIVIHLNNKAVAKKLYEIQGWYYQFCCQAEEFKSILARKRQRHANVSLSLITPFQHDDYMMRLTRQPETKIGSKRYFGLDYDLISQIYPEFGQERIQVYNVCTLNSFKGAMIGIYSEEVNMFIPQAIHLDHQIQIQDQQYNLGRKLYPDVIQFGIDVLEKLHLLIKSTYDSVICEWETEIFANMMR